MLGSRILFAVLILVSSGLAISVWESHREIQKNYVELARQVNFIHELEQRNSRLVDVVPVATIEQDHLWNGDTSEQVYSDIQSNTLTALQENDLNLDRYRPLPIQEELGLSRASVQLEVNGSLFSILSYLNESHRSNPPLASDQIVIRPLAERDQIDGTTQVSAQIRMWGYAQLDSGNNR